MDFELANLCPLPLPLKYPHPLSVSRACVHATTRNLGSPVRYAVLSRCRPPPPRKIPAVCLPWTLTIAEYEPLLTGRLVSEVMWRELSCLCCNRCYCVKLHGLGSTSQRKAGVETDSVDTYRQSYCLHLHVCSSRGCSTCQCTSLIC